MSKLCYTYVERGDVMKNDKLSVQSMDLAVSIVNLVKTLKEQRESVISNQIGRSGTSIGANIREAQYAHGKADFIAKLQIALKEANETGYWLELLFKTNYISEEEYKTLDSVCASIRVMLISSINTVKQINQNSITVFTVTKVAVFFLQITFKLCKNLHTVTISEALYYIIFIKGSQVVLTAFDKNFSCFFFPKIRAWEQL